LKPGNIMVTKDTAKVLDFGLAKFVDGGAAGPHEETLTASRALLGTPAYMSPEQVSGGTADARSDIFAFGLVLYEMLAGKRGFTANTPTGLAREILVEQPPPLPDVPDAVRHVLERCLAKDPEERWQTAHDLKLELEWAATAPAGKPVAAPQRNWKRWWPLAAAAAGLLAGALLLLRRTEPGFVTHSFTPFATEAGSETDPAWSPDGRTIAYAASIEGTRQIVTKAIGVHKAVQITRGKQECSAPFWSTDGRQIYFKAGQSIWTVGAAGGEPRLVLKGIVQVASLSRQGTLAFIRGVGGAMSLWVIPAGGGAEQRYQRAPFPDSFARVWTIDFSRDGSKLAILMERETATGFVTELWVLPFPNGTPERVLANLPFRVSSSNPGGSPHPRISWLPDQPRLLVDAEMEGHTGIQLHLIDLESKAIRPITSGVAHARAASVSSDGDKVAFVSGGDDFDILRVSIDGSEARPFLSTASREHDSAWAPSGKQFAYVRHGSGAGLWLKSLQEDLTFPVLLRGGEGVPAWYSLGQLVFSPRGDRIAYDAIAAKHMIWISPVTGGTPVPLDHDSIDQHGAAWSPDGNWIAYMRIHQGRWNVVKAPVGGGPPVVLAEDVGYGSRTAWSSDGAWIAYSAGGTIGLVTPDGKRRESLKSSGSSGFDFSKDSSRLYAIRREQDRTWVMSVVDVATAKERAPVKLPIPAETAVMGFSLHPDGKSFLTSVGNPESDIWILDGLRQSVSSLR
jgi:Tol biopolymer transport system component